MAPSDLGERLLRVEMQVSAITEADRQDEIIEKLAEIEKELTRYKGFFGGIAFVVTCIGIFLYKFALPVYGLIAKLKGN